ncbi:hypothetical protein HZB89_01360, partial [archaeon]|nr:hypothetical protein [archaeon]
MVLRVFDFIKKTACLLAALMFLAEIFALPVFAAQSFSSGNEVESNEAETELFLQAAGSCRTESLSAEEVQKLWDEVLFKGFRGQEFSSTDEAQAYREKLANDKLLISDQQKQLVLEQEMPSQAIQPNEVAFMLGKDIQGAFAFGTELDDSIRLGKCPEGSKYCALDGTGTQYRNSDQGFFKNLSKITTGNVEDKLKKLAASDVQEAKEGLKETDTNSTELYSVQKTQGKQLSNSVLVDFFNARLTTNCADDSCTILTYSLFDKMFNFGLSISMIATSFGPTFIDTTKRAFNFKGLNLKSALNKYYAKNKPSVNFYNPGLIEGINRDLGNVNAQAKFQEIMNEVIAGKVKATVKLEGLLKDATIEQQRVILKSLQKVRSNLEYAYLAYPNLDEAGKIALWGKTNDLLKYGL